MSNERTRANQDWANYRRFVHHKNALNMIFNYRPSADRDAYPETRQDFIGGTNADVQFDIERAADEEGVSVAEYLKGPSHDL